MASYVREIGFVICLGLLTWASLLTAAATLGGVIDVVVRGVNNTEDAGALIDRAHIGTITTVFTLLEVLRLIFLPGPKHYLMGLVWSVSFRGTVAYFLLLAVVGSFLFLGSLALQFSLVRDATPIAAETQRIWTWLAAALMVPAIPLGIFVKLPLRKSAAG